MIHFINVEKNFGTQQILTGASFSIFAKERVGLVGPNGAGKSTIFNLLMKEMTPDAGNISTPDNLRMAYVHQQVAAVNSDISVIDYAENAIPELSKIEKRLHEIEGLLEKDEPSSILLAEHGILQTRFEELGGYSLRARAEAILCGLGFRAELLKNPFRTFSGGWKIRAELARNLVADPDVLLLDEPTNYLDVPAVEWLQDFLRRFQGTLLLISHDRYLLNLLTTKTIEVAGGKTTIYAGNYQHYVQERESRYEQLVNAKKNQEKQLEKIEEFVERFRYKATKSNQVQSRLKQLEKIEEIVVVDTRAKYSRIILPDPPACGNEIWRCKDLDFGYPNKELLFKKLTMSIVKGEKIGIVGLNGLGKTTLLRLIVGHLKATFGEVILGHHVEIGYQGQDYTEVMDPNLTVFEVAKRAANGQRKEAEIRQILGSFRFPGTSIEKQVQVLSGGEKVRLALARLLLSPCNFIVLDEPTTHLDIGTREALEDALAHYKGTLLFVSHDIMFVKNVATSIWALDVDGLTKYYGNYDYYHEKLAQNKLAQEDHFASHQENTERNISKGELDKQRKREQAELRQEWSKKRLPLEKRIQKTEAQVIALEEEQEQLLELFSDPDFKLSESQAKRLGELKILIIENSQLWETLVNEFDELQQTYKEKIEGI